MTETIQSIPLGELHAFLDHPFTVCDDDAIRQTVESIKEYGVLVPAIARPREEGGYEIIAGHRRKHMRTGKKSCHGNSSYLPFSTLRFYPNTRSVVTAFLCGKEIK